LSGLGVLVVEKFCYLKDNLQKIYQQSSSLALQLLLKNHLPMPAGTLNRKMKKVCYETTDSVK